MQPEFSPPITRFDAVLWFLRVQLWLFVCQMVAGSVIPLSFLFSGYQFSSLIGQALPILLLAVFPRVLASAILGASAVDAVSSTADLRPLVWRCVGVALFIGSMGRTILFTLSLGYDFFTRGSFSMGGMPGFLFYSQIISIGITFFLGFTLAFGPAIRDAFRPR